MKKWAQALLMALGMFTILPTPANSWQENVRGRVVPLLPLVGFCLGLIWWGIAFLLFTVFGQSAATAALVALMPFLLTGFLHLDGLVDTADAIGSRRPLAEKRRILKDPHLGAFGGAAMGVVFLLLFAAVQTWFARGAAPLLLLVLIPVLPRAIAAIGLLRLSPMSKGGYVATFRQGDQGFSVFLPIFFMGVTLGAGFLIFGIFGVVILAIGGLCAGLNLWYNVSQLEGISGDLCGSSIVVGEVFGCLAAALLGGIS